MFLPEITKKKCARVSVTRFAGMDAHLTAPAGQFLRAVNVSSDEYPTLTVRPPRRQVGEWVDGGQRYAVVIENAICYVAGSTIFINRRGEDGIWVEGAITDFLDPNVTEERWLVPYSYYLLVFPDQVYINTLDILDRGDMSEPCRLFGATGQVEAFVCNREGTGVAFVGGDYSDTSSYDGDRGFDGMLWLKQATDDDGARLYRLTYNEETSKCKWQETDAYIELSNVVGDVYEQRDYGCLQTGEMVSISLAADNVTNSEGESVSISPIQGVHYLEEAKVETRDAKIGTTYHEKIRFRGILNEAIVKIPATVQVTARRVIPNFDCAVTHGGRVYGARRGISNVTGEDVNEIYISAADDFRRYYRMEDTAADPLIMSVTEAGRFHRAAVIDGTVTFFKDHRVLEIGGATTSGFYIEPREGRRPAFDRTLCTPDGIAYYLATEGEVVARCNGATTTVGHDLGTRLLGTVDACAGVSGQKYYLYTESETGEKLIYVYDAAAKVWQSESVERGVAFFAEGPNGLLIFERADTPGGVGRILAVDRQSTVGGVPPEEADMAWVWETGLLGLDTPRKKYISRVEVRLLMEPGAEVFLWAQYDSREEWEPLWRAEAETLRTVSSRTVPRRCDHVRLRMEGHGRVTLLGLFYEYRESGT